MVAVQVAAAMAALAVLEQLHFLTLQAAAVAAADMAQISAGTVILDTPDAPVVVDQPVRITVPHTEQGVVVVPELTDRVITVPVVAHTTVTVQEQAANLDQTALAVFQANLGQTAKDTAITAAAITAVAVAAAAHHMAVVGAAKALFELFGLAQLEHTQTMRVKIFNIR